ncbi:Crp/Fnr family transcriptional regulator [Endozoicomonas sp. OPT23]|uniref:sugar-binding transcriptional regulator n=1 Tax=Endozoicomonas sp. OPT23 TaxID=2072845 RepID=UPI00129AECFC|nr:sugar-binding transcriptional regulator [Endozoicomonas sp. OPT23]MRI35147.1 Crp/Fnr family transcriptional regulator [Endozoicomonas sp. OPT23]
MNSMTDFDNARLFTKVISLHYIEERSQSDIAKTLGLSTAKVNRIIRQAREQGWIEISINTPFKHLFDIEQRIKAVSNISDVVIAPDFSTDANMMVKSAGAAAASYLLENLKDNCTICVSGGKAVSAIVDEIRPRQEYKNITVVPATGGVQGKHYTDVNHLASQLAEKLGGSARQLHAPLFADSASERNMLLKVRQTKEILDQARKADIALLGIGSILPDDSSYFDLYPASANERSKIEKADAVGDLFAHLYDSQGFPCLPEYNDKLVGLTLDELQDVSLSIGVSAGPDKIAPISGALRSGRLKTLITDESTSLGVLEVLEKNNK